MKKATKHHMEMATELVKLFDGGAMFTYQELATKMDRTTSWAGNLAREMVRCNVGEVRTHGRTKLIGFTDIMLRYTVREQEVWTAALLCHDMED